MRRLLLVRHAPTAATRAAAFGVDEPVDARGLAAAAAVGDVLPSGCEALVSPALRCRQTAAAVGLRSVSVVEPALAECDFGAWAGRALTDINEEDPVVVAAWIADPDARPHGGESLRAFAARVADWVDGQARLGGSAVAVTHAGVVKAALVHALGAPLEAFWRIDVAPLSITELHAHDGRWTITRVNCMSNIARYPLDVRHDRSGAAA
jgi:broad specificity phosphatase PhoE